jgi:hypothetical protein
MIEGQEDFSVVDQSYIYIYILDFFQEKEGYFIL